MNFKTFALATVASLGISTAASAATLSLSGGSSDTLKAAGTAGTNFRLCQPGEGNTTCFNPNGLAAGLVPVGFQISEFFSSPVGLTISGPATIKVTYLGKEANARNTAFTLAGGSIQNLNANVGDSFTSVVNTLGPWPAELDFNFSSALGTAAGSAGFVAAGSATAGIAFSNVFSGGKSVYAFFDDSGATQDRDWDDMVVRIDVLSQVPVPAAGFLLLGGLGGLAALKRRKAA